MQGFLPEKTELFNLVPKQEKGLDESTDETRLKFEEKLAKKARLRQG